MKLSDLLRKPGDVVEIVRVPHHQDAPEGYTRLASGRPCHHDRFAFLAAKKIDQTGGST